MSEFDVKFAAYESMMKRNNNFGMSGDVLARYYGDYSVRLQDAITRKEQKAFNKEYGKFQAKQIAEQRAAEVAKFDKVYSQNVMPALNEQFVQPKNPLLKGITYEQSQQQRLIAEVKPQPLHEALYREVIEPKLDAEFGKPKNPLLESIKPNQDFRGKNLIGEEFTKAQKILQEPLNPELKTTSKLAKFGKWGAAIAGIAALGIGVFALLKGCDNDEETRKAQQADNPLNKKPIVAPSDSTGIAKTDSIQTEKQDSTVVKPIVAPSDSTGIAKTDSIQTEKQDSTVVKPIVAPSDSTEIAKTQKTKQVQESAQAEQSQEAQNVQYIPLLQLDEDGAYTTKYKDSFWKIAEKHLKDKFKAEGIDRKPTNAEIQKETDRIMALNEYGYDSNHWFSNPMLHPNVKLIIEQKLDKAA